MLNNSKDFKPPVIPKEKHDHGPLKFPDEFLWGASTSAYQVEGNNINSDWWYWEQKHQPSNKKSGLCCDQYNRFEEDFGIAKELSLNAHRLSIEWSRIEPRMGEFDQEEIEHYKKVLKSLKDKKFSVMLTLWHFTLPEWLAKKGGWENGEAVKFFLRFLDKIIPEFKEYVDFWITLNEPSVYAYMAYISGDWPPQKKSILKSFFVMLNLAKAHNKAFEKIHKLVPHSKVGIAHNIQSFETYHKHSITELLAVGFGDLLTNHFFYALTRKHHDFLGINYYFHHRVKKVEGMIPELINVNKEEYRDVTDLGWEVYPEGLFEVLTDLADHIPIYITECGIASTNDDRRTRFLINYLSEVYRAIHEGVPIKGFFYWSLVDNFEWHQGFDPRFGLVEIDYPTQRRTIRPSAYVYQDIIKENGIPHSLLRLLGHTVTADEVLCYLHEGPKSLCEHHTHARFPKFSKEIEVKKS